MLTLSEYFKEFLSNIEPPEHRLATAEEIPDDVRRYLKLDFSPSRCVANRVG